MLVLFPRLKYNLLESNSFKVASFLAGWQHSKSSSQAWMIEQNVRVFQDKQWRSS